MNRSIAARIGLCVLVLWITPLRADETEDTADDSPAQAHFQRGLDLFHAGRFAAALVQFEESRRIEVLHRVDYNIGRCYERLNDLQGAIEAYERFLRTEPSWKHADELRGRIVTLRDRMAEQVPLRIAVLPPRMGPAVPEPLRERLRRAVARGASPPGVLPMSPDEIEQKLEVAPELRDCADAACAARAATLLGATRVVLTDVDQLGKNYRIRVRSFTPWSQLAGAGEERCDVCTQTEAAQATERAASRAGNETVAARSTETDDVKSN